VWNFVWGKPNGPLYTYHAREKHVLRRIGSRERMREEGRARLAVGAVASRILQKVEVVNTMQRLEKKLE